MLPVFYRVGWDLHDMEVAVDKSGINFDALDYAPFHRPWDTSIDLTTITSSVPKEFHYDEHMPSDTDSEPAGVAVD